MNIKTFAALKDAIRKLPDARSYKFEEINMYTEIWNNEESELACLTFIKCYEQQDKKVYIPPAYLSIGFTVPGQHIVKSNIVDYYWRLSEKSKKYLKSLK